MTTACWPAEAANGPWNKRHSNAHQHLTSCSAIGLQSPSSATRLIKDMHEVVERVWCFVVVPVEIMRSLDFGDFTRPQAQRIAGHAKASPFEKELTIARRDFFLITVLCRWCPGPGLAAPWIRKRSLFSQLQGS